MSNTAGALGDIRVIEFAQNLAVPQCGRLLAAMGADVVKVEPPAGDNMRHLAPFDQYESRAYATANPGKRTITVDLTAEGAGDVVDSLLRWADVVLVGMKQSDHARFGLDWEHIHEVNPRAIHLAFNAFGPEGPDADQGGYDVLAQAVSGLGFSMNRTVDGVPRATRPAAIDSTAGVLSALGVVVALRNRDATGEGQRVDASLLGAAMLLGTPMFAGFERDADKMAEIAEEMDLLRAGGASFDDQRTHYESRVIAGAGAFALYFRPYGTADGIVSVAGLSPVLFSKFHDVTGLDTPTSHDPNEPEFRRIIDEAEALFRTRTTAEWIDELRAVGYPCQRYNLPYQSIVDPQVRANDYVVDLEHPVIGRYSTCGVPFRFSSLPAAITEPSPTMGAHTAEVLAEAGYDTDAIARLTAESIVVDGPPQ